MLDGEPPTASATMRDEVGLGLTSSSMFAVWVVLIMKMSGGNTTWVEQCRRAFRASHLISCFKADLHIHTCHDVKT